MSDLTHLIRLQAWLSPAFPTGAFSYSHGLEAAIAAGAVHDAASFQAWLSALVKHGPGWNDAVLMSAAWHARNADELDEICTLAKAMSFSAERHLETMAQGGAFLEAARAWDTKPTLTEETPLPVAVGAVCGKLAIPLEAALAAFLHAYISNQIQAALRLMSLGQRGGVEVLANLEVLIVETAKLASNATLEDLGASTFYADIAAMNHETMTSRIFRS